MGKSNTKNKKQLANASVCREIHHDVYEIPISEFRQENYSKHRSCWRHMAASLNAQGKVTKKENEEIKKRFERISPCFSGIVYCRKKRSKRKDPGLRPRLKMNDSTFDNHLENIWRSVSEDKRSSFAQVGSMCFSLYKRERSRGLKLIKKEDIFSKKYVFVPIVCWDHWRLVIFCNFGEAAHSETRTRCILLLDSVEMGAREIEADIRKFVFDIFEAEGRPEIKDVIYRIPLLVPKVPQQTNDIDCGRFVLYFIKQFMDVAPENLSISNGHPHFMESDWCDFKNFEHFCNKLEKESPIRTQGIGVTRRVSQRIKKTNVLSRKSSRQDVVVMID